MRGPTVAGARAFGNLVWPSRLMDGGVLPRVGRMTDAVAADPWSGFDGHERVIVARDPESGVDMVVALHSTVLGPALGGTRMNAYAGGAQRAEHPHQQGTGEPSPRAAAYADALRLSRAMTFKNSLAGLDHGGGKAVIIADPSARTPEILHAYGRLVSSLNGDYVTAGDVGISVADLDVISEACPWTTGRSPERGGLGDSAILTAVGVLAGMQASITFALGRESFEGTSVGIVGLGKVGGRLAEHLTAAGAIVTAFDPDPSKVEQALGAAPGLRAVASLEELLATPVDVLSPNALGGLITSTVASTSTAKVICGAANNQLASPHVATMLAERGITYAPDFMVNCGGVIQISQEFIGGTMEEGRRQAEAVHGTTLRVLERAASSGVTPVTAAEEEALERIRRSSS